MVRKEIPKTSLPNEQVWNDPAMIKSQLANLYDRIPQLHGNFNTGGMCELMMQCIVYFRPELS